MATRNVVQLAQYAKTRANPGRAEPAPENSPIYLLDAGGGKACLDICGVVSWATAIEILEILEQKGELKGAAPSTTGAL